MCKVNSAVTVKTISPRQPCLGSADHGQGKVCLEQNGSLLLDCDAGDGIIVLTSMSFGRGR